MCVGSLIGQGYRLLAAGALALLTLLNMATPAQAQQDTSYSLEKWIVQGGGRSEGGEYTLFSEIGSAEAQSGVATGATYWLHGGFWHPENDEFFPGPRPYTRYLLPLILETVNSSSAQTGNNETIFLPWLSQGP